ncbi:MAG: GreA/GreB family elongation factor [Burkholderiales bacterium]|nr:GreA/GreB family elongation factor [Burkholderiales bacterium]
MKHPHTICITDRDATRLARIVEDLFRRPDAIELGAEVLYETLDAASVVPSPEIAVDVITMNSEAVIEDAGGVLSTVTLAYPEQADPACGRISVLSPFGNALLGARIGEQVHVDTPAGRRTVRIVSIGFQPEAAGRDDL